MLILYFYSHLKMTSERSKRRDFISLNFITKSISKKLLIRTKKTLHVKNTPLLYFSYMIDGTIFIVWLPRSFRTPCRVTKAVVNIRFPFPFSRRTLNVYCFPHCCLPLWDGSDNRRLEYQVTVISQICFILYFTLSNDSFIYTYKEMQRGISERLDHDFRKPQGLIKNTLNQRTLNIDKMENFYLVH